MTKIDEIARTYWSGKQLATEVSWDEMARRTDARSKRIVAEIRNGLLAVIETHVKPMLAEAFARGMFGMVPGQSAQDESGNMYADRIIATLKEQV